MTLYFAIKLVHIVSATLLFGTGLGTAFFMWSAYRSGNLQALRVTNRHVVIADWLFTAPAVVVQLVSGLWLVSFLRIPLGSAWFVSVSGLFVLIGLCWLPVVWIQVRLSKLIAENAVTDLSPGYRRLMAIWVGLGIPAFLSMLVLFGLMVFKPGVSRILIGD